MALHRPRRQITQAHLLFGAAVVAEVTAPARAAYRPLAEMVARRARPEPQARSPAVAADLARQHPELAATVA